MSFLFKNLSSPRLKLLGLKAMSTSCREAQISGIFFVFVLSFFLFPLTTQANTLTRIPSNLGLVGYWSMNEGVGTAAGDFSGSLNHSAFQGTPTWVNGKLGKGLNFFNLSHYIQVPDSNSLDSVSDITLSAWIKLNANSDTQFIIEKSGNYGIQVTGGLLRLQWSNSGIQVKAIDVTAPIAGQWHHVVGVVSGDEPSQVYIDGVLQSSSSYVLSTGVIRVLTNPITFGSGFGGGYAGSIDEVRIYNRALSVSEIATLYNTKVATRKTVSNSGLVGYWPFEEGSGTQLGDFSGNKNIGTMVNFENPPTATSGWGNGKRGKGLLFDNNDTDRIIIQDSTSLTLGSATTFSGWVKLRNIPGAGKSYIFQLIGDETGTCGSTIWRIGSQGSALYAQRIGINFRNPTDHDIQNNTDIPLNVWTHVAVTTDGANARFYLNGVLDTTTEYGITPQNTSCEWGIGWNSGVGRYFEGTLDDFRLYNRTLSDDEIYVLYILNQSAAGKAQTNVVTNGLVGYWPFGGNNMNWGTNQALDASGNGNTGNLTSMSTSTSPVQGKVGQALYFTGSNDIDAGSSAVTDDLGSMSVCAWIKPTAPPPSYWGGIASKSTGSGSDGWQFYIYGSESPYNLGFFNTDGDAIEGATGVIVNEWQHVCGTWDGNAGLTGRKVYINGVSISGSLIDFTAGSSDSGYSLGIGTLGLGSPYYFTGQIDETRLYDRELTTAEVLQLYRAGK